VSKGSVLASYSYELNLTGDFSSATELSGRTVNWTYDNIYRLATETISADPHSKNGAVAYGLDPVGNRLSQVSTLPGIPTGSFTFDADDRILSSETYDNNGNTTVSGAKTFTYNFENRLKSMNGGAVTLQYDGDGNRVTKTVGGVTTRYLVDDHNPTGYPQVVEELIGGAVQRTYTHGRQRISQNQLISTTWMPSFYAYDGLGSVRLLADATGAMTDTVDYDAWGNAVNVTGSTPNVYLYRGEQYDSDLGLYYLRARYFNPLTGRFLTTDPGKGSIQIPQTLHKYLYVGGNPVRFVDPTGYDAADEQAELSNISISFGHGARHLVGTGLSQAQVEAAIEAVTRELLASGNVAGNFWAYVQVEGIDIWFRAYFVTSVLLNIGTYTIGH